MNKKNTARNPINQQKAEPKHSGVSSCGYDEQKERQKKRNRNRYGKLLGISTIAQSPSRSQHPSGSYNGNASPYEENCHRHPIIGSVFPVRYAKHKNEKRQCGVRNQGGPSQPPFKFTFVFYGSRRGGIAFSRMLHGLLNNSNFFSKVFNELFNLLSFRLLRKRPLVFFPFFRGNMPYALSFYRAGRGLATRIFSCRGGSSSKAPLSAPGKSCPLDWLKTGRSRLQEFHETTQIKGATLAFNCLATPHETGIRHFDFLLGFCEVTYEGLQFFTCRLKSPDKLGCSFLQRFNVFQRHRGLLVCSQDRPNRRVHSVKYVGYIAQRCAPTGTTKMEHLGKHNETVFPDLHTFFMPRLQCDTLIFVLTSVNNTTSSAKFQGGKS